MCEALAEIMAPELEANMKKGRDEGLAEGRVEGKVLAFAEMGLSLQEIADKVCLSLEEVERIIESDEN